MVTVFLFQFRWDNPDHGEGTKKIWIVAINKSNAGYAWILACRPGVVFFFAYLRESSFNMTRWG